MRDNTVAEPLSPEEERGLRLAIDDDDTTHISVEHARRLVATLEAARQLAKRAREMTEDERRRGLR